MAQTLQEYADWLDRRDELIWPKPPHQESPKATPYTKPLSGIRAVTWNVYGTLLHIADGKLLHLHSEQLRMQVALEKTIQEFNMWNSMSRKPGAPWEYMFKQYQRLVQDAQLVGTGQKGDFPEIDSVQIWRKLIERLQQNEYTYDESFYGDLDDLSLKVAYFFHSSLQGVEATASALETLVAVSRSGMLQGLVCDAQAFTFVQTLRALRQQGTLPVLDELFAPSCQSLSHQQGLRQPSKSLYAVLLQQLDTLGIAPREVVHVGSRLRDDLAVAKQFGMKTVLFAGDKASLQASADEVKDPELRPDRLATDLTQIQMILDVS